MAADPAPGGDQAGAPAPAGQAPGAPSSGARSSAAPATGASPAFDDAPAAKAPAQAAAGAPASTTPASSAPATGASAARTAGDTATVHPGTPLVPGAAPAGPRGPAARPADRPAADATQAVTLPPAGARPPGGQSAPEGGRGRSVGGAARGAASRGPRRARLQLRHVDIWSAFKISLVVSFALFFVWMIAIGILYFVLGKFGVFDTINDLVGQVSGDDKGDVVHVGVVLGGAALIGLVNVVLLTALSTIATYVYNLFADLVGGLEVTLAERE
ncbi:DUF3566 domain-containing protein [Modestobacter sp. NPDC049651]|uniref:DUF3566 domain-containing protein n=1 Tax=unclassified Modestobacter TaxID=2643866 RepID=UPI0033F9C7BF